MRIGNLEDMQRQENGTLFQPAPPESYSKREKWKNWWYYYKWYVICGILLLGILCNIAGNALGLWKKSPDFQVAYIGKSILPPEAVSTLEQAFSSIAADFNGDGEIIVKVNQYIDGLSDTDAEAIYYEYASETSLIGDISDCGSYFFLLEDPIRFQLEYQLLAAPDGSCPEAADYSVEDKIILWADSPILTRAWSDALSSAEGEVPSANDIHSTISGLSLGRRCFYTDKVADHAEECDALWNTLYLKERKE